MLRFRSIGTGLSSENNSLLITATPFVAEPDLP